MTDTIVLVQNRGKDAVTIQLMEKAFVVVVDVTPDGGGWDVMLWPDPFDENAYAFFTLSIPGATESLCKRIFDLDVDGFNPLSILKRTIADDFAYFFKTGKYHIDEDVEIELGTEMDENEVHNFFDLDYHIEKWDQLMTDLAIKSFGKLTYAEN